MIYFIAFKIKPIEEVLSIQRKFNLNNEFTKENQFHCTLLFLDNNINENEVINIINKINFEPINTKVLRLNKLSDARYKNAIVLELSNDKLIEINSYLKNKLNIKNNEDYIPHITLLRTNQNIKLKEINSFEIILKEITLFKADIVNNEVIYQEIFTKNLDSFENLIQNILEDLKNLNKIENIDAGILYGSTASGKIKRPVHDIDIYLLTKNITFPLESIKRIKEMARNIENKYSSDKFHVSSWCVGLGKVFEMHKIEKNKLHVGIELMPLSLVTNNQVSGNEISNRGLKVLFGNADSFLSLGDRFNLYKEDSSVEFLASRILSDIISNNKNIFNLYLPFFIYSFLKNKKILFKSKGDAIQKFKELFPNVKIPENGDYKDLLKFYKNLINYKENSENSIIIEYPEFVLKRKRNFLVLANINKIDNLKLDGYIRHAYHSPNLLFLENKSNEIKDFLIYPLQNKSFSEKMIFLAELIRLYGKNGIKFGKNKVTKLNLLKFGPFTLDTAETTLKTLYYNFDIKKDKFIFWYTSLATILQTSFAYLVTDGKYELDPKKILDNMKKYGFKYFNFELVLKNIENQEVKDVEELYKLACNFIDKLAEKVISEIKS